MAATVSKETFQPTPINGTPLSMEFLRRSMPKTTLTHFLRFFARRNTVMFEDDFMLKALDTTNVYTVAAGGTATTWAITAVEDGIVRGVSGTTAATSGLQISLPGLNFTGVNNCGCEIRWQSSVVTETRFEMGFVDALPSVNTNIVNSLVTPTFNTTAKGVLYVFDHTGATNTSGLYTIGSAVAAAKVAVTAPLPAASVYNTARIQINGTKVSMWVNDILVAQPSADAITAADLVKFVFAHKKSDTTTSNVDIDYIRVWKDRALA